MSGGTQEVTVSVGGSTCVPGGELGPGDAWVSCQDVIVGARPVSGKTLLSSHAVDFSENQIITFGSGVQAHLQLCVHIHTPVPRSQSPRATPAGTSLSASAPGGKTWGNRSAGPNDRVLSSRTVGHMDSNAQVGPGGEVV